MKKILILLILLLIPIGNGISKVKADPFTCTGYPEQRVFIESHVWWIQNGDTLPKFGEGRHIHVVTCFPLNHHVRGTVHLDVMITLHNDPGIVKALRIQAFNVATWTVPLNLRCTTPDASGDCVYTIPIDLDTIKVPNGEREFRITANIPNNVFGQRMYQTTRWHMIIDNPGASINPGSESASRSPGAAGWYHSTYANVFCGPNDGYNLVSHPISGVISITCKFDQQTAKAAIDSNSHLGIPGTVVLNTTGGTRTITFDTRTLSNGPHKLVLATDRSFSDGSLRGQLILHFTVQN